MKSDTLLSSRTMSLRASRPRRTGRPARRVSFSTASPLKMTSFGTATSYAFCLAGRGRRGGRPRRAIAPEIAESIRSAMRFPMWRGIPSVTVSSLSNDATGRKSTVSSVDRRHPRDRRHRRRGRRYVAERRPRPRAGLPAGRYRLPADNAVSTVQIDQELLTALVALRPAFSRAPS